MKPGSHETTPGTPFSRLLAMLRPDLVRFALWLARDRAVAEDVVQETLIRAWKSRAELKDPGAARELAHLEALAIFRCAHVRASSPLGRHVGTALRDQCAGFGVQLQFDSERLGCGLPRVIVGR